MHTAVVVLEPEVLIIVDGLVDEADSVELVKVVERHISLSPLLIDLSGVQRLARAGVEALLEVHLLVIAQGGRLHVLDPSPVAQRVLDGAGLNNVLHIRRRPGA